MKKYPASLALIAGLALTASATAQTTTAVTTYKKVKLCLAADKSKQGKAEKIEGTLNLDPDSKNVLFVVNEKVNKTIPYHNISSLEFYMANHMLRILYHNGMGEETYVDMDLPTGEQPDLLKQLQAQTGIAIRLS
jgi:hypothetical protein